jgi:hypothetical protein
MRYYSLGYVTLFDRKGRPQGAKFFTLLLNMDSFCLAHLQWLCQYSTTIDNKILASLQWLYRTQNLKETKQ